MARRVHTQVFLEQAFQHVLSEQGKLLKRPDCSTLTEILSELNSLAADTGDLLIGGTYRIKSTTHLTKRAKILENAVDELSEKLWTPIPLSISSIYERVEESLIQAEGKDRLVSDLRAHYHNLRLRLLEQMLGARMLVQNSDLGEEIERIWQQFLQQHLGPGFRILRGGHICDHDGNCSSQVDLIVVPAEAQIIVPGDSRDGKAQVLIDQVISAIMVTARLSADKLKNDWRSLQSVPRFNELEKDYPQLRGQPWPLFFILGMQSAPVEDLEKAWCELCAEGLKERIPQFVISLDGGFLYSGITKRPRPRYPSNYVEPDHVAHSTGVFTGLGLAWLIAQHQGRLAMLKNQPLGSVDRFAGLLDKATERFAPPPSYSDRFMHCSSMLDIAGIMAWGSAAMTIHNRLRLNSLRRKLEGTKSILDFNYFQDGTDGSMVVGLDYPKHLRFFTFEVHSIAGDLLALEEWIEPGSKERHQRRIAVFNIHTGNEIKTPEVAKMQSVHDVKNLVA